MELPIVQILLKGRVLQEVPFRRDTLRIGRMKENDVVINNLAVSRFHAALHRAEHGVELEDLGSENGCYVNGARVRGRVPLGPGDEVRIGKHTLLWRLGEATTADPAAGAPAARSDAWDAAQTYYGGIPGADADLPAAAAAGAGGMDSAPTGPPVDAPAEEPATVSEPLGAGSGAELDLEAEGAELSLGGADSDIDPVAEGLDLDGLEGMDLAADDLDLGEDAGDRSAVAEEDFGAAAAEMPSPAAAEPADAELDLSDEAFDRAFADPSPEEGSAGPDPEAGAGGADGEAGLTSGRYPGFILQREGRLERVFAWQAERLAVAPEGEGALRFDAAPAEARALFVREGERFLARAAEAEILTVNGEEVAERALEVGDVVAIGDWQLTFVLDHEPIRNEVLAASGPPPAAGAEAPDPEGEMDPPTVELRTPAFAAAAERDLLSEPEEDEEKELSVHVTSAGRGPEPVALGPMAPLLVELEIQPGDLPEPLRNLVDALDGGEVSVPVRLRLRAGRR